LPNVAGQLLPKAAEKALDMGHLATGLSNLLVRWVLFEHWTVGFPEVAEALCPAVLLRNPAPEPSAGSGAAVPDDKRHNLPGSPAESYPQPPFIRSLSDVGPTLVELKDIALLGRLDFLGERTQSASLFSSQRLSVLRLIPKIRLIARFDPRSR